MATDCSLFSGLVRVQVEPVKIVPYKGPSQNLDACADENSENGAGVYS